MSKEMEHFDKFASLIQITSNDSEIQYPKLDFDTWDIRHFIYWKINIWDFE